MTTFLLLHFLPDGQDPTITCPDDFSQDTDPSAATALVTLPSATASDNSDTEPTITTNPEGPGATLPIGDNTVTYTVTDGAGRMDSCDVTVTVNGTFLS